MQFCRKNCRTVGNRGVQVFSANCLALFCF
ncbi:MAG: hypothetical protein [Siphoviridae sp. cttb18]|nr:MAG: hypothetical protein [Siphoviridae sp. cttb18]